MPNSPVIWLCTPPYRRDNAEELRAALNSIAQVQTLILGSSGHPAPEIDLGVSPNLAVALETCPADLRPAACVCLSQDLPKGIDCLPCPVLGWAGGAGLEGHLPQEAMVGAHALLAAIEASHVPLWLTEVQINLPLKDLLGRYRALVQSLPLNLEVGVDADALDELGSAELQIANDLLVNRRVTAHLAFMDLAPGSRDPKIREVSRQRLLAAAGLAGRIKAEQAVAHLGFDHRTNPAPKEWVLRAAPVFAELAESLADQGCRLALENVFEQDPGVHLLLLDAMARLTSIEVGFCLDAGHALAFSATHLEEWWNAFEPRLWELHLHDNEGGNDDHLPVGWGAVDWSVIAKGLALMGHRPVITLEPHREPHLWGSLRGMEKLFRIG